MSDHEALSSECESATRSLDSDDPSAHLEHKTSLEKYAFLLQWFVSEAEKASAKVDEDPAGRKVRSCLLLNLKQTHIYAALFQKKVKAAASSKKGDKWNWVGQIPQTLIAMVKVLRLQTSRIWTTTQEKDAFVRSFSSSIASDPRSSTHTLALQLLHPARLPTRRERRLHEDERDQDAHLQGSGPRGQVSCSGFQ